jgi:hypothetical protein
MLRDEHQQRKACSLCSFVICLAAAAAVFRNEEQKWNLAIEFLAALLVACGPALNLLRRRAAQSRIWRRVTAALVLKPISWRVHSSPEIGPAQSIVAVEYLEHT